MKLCRIKYKPDQTQATGIKRFYLSTEHPDLIDINDGTLDLNDDGGTATLRFKILPQKERGLLRAMIHVTNAKDPDRASFAEILIFDIVAKVDPNFVPPPDNALGEMDQPPSPEKQLRPEVNASESSFSLYSQQPESIPAVPPKSGDLQSTIQDLAQQVQELRSAMDGNSPTHSTRSGYPYQDPSFTGTGSARETFHETNQVGFVELHRRAARAPV